MAYFFVNTFRFEAFNNLSDSITTLPYKMQPEIELFVEKNQLPNSNPK